MAEEAERTGAQAQPSSDAETAGGNGTATAPAAGAGEAAQAENKAPSAEATLLEQARKEAAGHYDRALRLQAEFENYKRRMHKEQSEMQKFAQLPLLKELTGIVDNLERAIAHGRAGNTTESQSIVAGLELVTRQINEVFEKFGLTRIAAKGTPFDPRKHEAMKVVESEDAPENTVVEEFRTGYMLHDRVVRPSWVVVTKKPPVQGGNEAT